MTVPNRKVKERIAGYLRCRILNEVDDGSDDGITPWDECKDKTKGYWLIEVDKLLNLGICPDCRGSGKFGVEEDPSQLGDIICPSCLGTGGEKMLAIVAENQELPTASSISGSGDYCDSYFAGYSRARYDMIKAGWKKVEELEK